MNRFSDRYYDDKIIDVYSRYLTTQHKLPSGLAVLPTIAQRSVLLLSALVFSRAVRGDFSRLAYAGFDQICPLIRSSTVLGVHFFDARFVAWHMIILLPNDNGFLLFALRVVVMPISVTSLEHFSFLPHERAQGLLEWRRSRGGKPSTMPVAFGLPPWHLHGSLNRKNCPPSCSRRMGIVFCGSPRKNNRS